MKYLVVATLEGSLGPIEGAITIDAQDPSASSVHASIDVTAVRTGIRLRDAHLRSSDFFDVKHFPRITFVSEHLEPIGSDVFRVRGRLTIRDITEPVALDVTVGGEEIDEHGVRRARFQASAVLSRRAFGLGTRTPMETTGLIASDRVDVTLRIGAVAA